MQTLREISMDDGVVYECVVLGNGVAVVYEVVAGDPLGWMPIAGTRRHYIAAHEAWPAGYVTRHRYGFLRTISFSEPPSYQPRLPSSGSMIRLWQAKHDRELEMMESESAA